ncbi:50S ribosomal protein L17 [Alphaproteobacteria bacterium endosymbiont of Tiliacea citrago]|uniref:50S ribosomal protein L17 n=1 Tax=Alphaproteobacteria bacterium endosymbiont of Tiliacea citrago TaxID=3077944 RepID=UPI00313B3F27
MKHQVKHYKLGRDTKHRTALRYNLIRSTVLHKKIDTTLAKAKCVQPILEKLITKAKISNLETRRYLLSFFRNDEIVVKRIFEIAEQLKEINGGYSKIVKLGQRKGDSAHIARLCFSGDIL